MVIDYENLINMARKARDHAYSPYSSYKVGASLLLSDGTVYSGCNIENASYGETVCAERVAVFKAISEGRQDFVAICVVGGINEILGFAYPCGACRQVLSEFCSPSLEIVLFNGNEFKICTLGELLPHSFDKKSIN